MTVLTIKKKFWLSAKVIAIIGVVFTSLITISRTLPGNDKFKRVLYNELEGVTKDTEHLRTGNFTTEYSTIERFNTYQIDTQKDTGENLKHSIEWLNNDEYRLINLGSSYGMTDTLYVKITDINANGYTCYLKFGEFAEKLEIVKDK